MTKSEFELREIPADSPAVLVAPDRSRANCYAGRESAWGDYTSREVAVITQGRVEGKNTVGDYGYRRRMPPD